MYHCGNAISMATYGWYLGTIISVVYAPSVNKSKSSTYTEEVVKPFISQMNADYAIAMKTFLESSWQHEITRDAKALEEKNTKLKVLERIIEDGHHKIAEFDLNKMRNTDEFLKTQLDQIGFLFKSNIPADLKKHIDLIREEINEIYTKTKFCDVLDVDGKCDMNISDVKAILRDRAAPEKVLKYYWLESELKIARKIRPLFDNYNDLMKKVAIHHGFKSTYDYIKYTLGISKIKVHEEMLQLWGKFLPFYYQLHTFFKKKLCLKYRHGFSMSQRSDHIPVYLLETIRPKNNIFIPYPDVAPTIFDIIQSHHTQKDLVDLAEKYYHSLNLPRLKEIVKQNITPILIETSDNRNMIAWNFFDADYRFMWTSSGFEENMRNIYQGVGCIQNMMAFGHLPPVLQNWPSEIIREAVSGALAMSAFSPFCLANSTLISDPNAVTDQVIVNGQLVEMMKLFRTTTIGVVTDLSRWGIFLELFTSDKFNEYWWADMTRILGIEPSREQNKEDFGPGTIKYMVDGTKYFKDFASLILKHQFFQTLCVAAGQFNPKKPKEKQLHLCDISNNEYASKLLKKVMALGKTVTWEKYLDVMTGQKKLNIKPFLNYYEPLIQWLNTNVGQFEFPMLYKIRNDIFSKQLRY